MGIKANAGTQEHMQGQIPKRTLEDVLLYT